MAMQPFAGRGPAHWIRPVALLASPVILALFIALFAAPRAGQAQGETLVRCNPAVAGGIVGQPLDVDIYVENVTNLWAADVRFGFDINIAQVVDANPDPNAPGVQLQLLDTFLMPDYVARNEADNTAGTLRYAATQVSTQPPNPPRLPATGSGPLARITFQAVKAGSFSMPITEPEFSTKEGKPIEVTLVDCQVTFIVVNTDLSIYLPVSLDMN